MVMPTRKPGNKDTLFREQWKEKSRKGTQQDWSQSRWEEVKNE